MFSKSNLLATVTGAIFLFLGGYLIWDILLADFFAAHAGSATGVMKDPAEPMFIALGSILQAFVLSTIYGKWARGVHSVKEGFEFGALFGVITGFAIGFIWYGVANLSDMTGVLASGVVEVIYVGLTGAVIALVYKSTASK